MTNRSENELRLEEYRQLCEYHRHDDIIKWTILGLGYTAGGALLSFAIDDDNSRAVSCVLLLLAFLAVICVTVIYFDVDHDTRKRLIRLHEVEMELGMDNHRRFDHPGSNISNSYFTVNRIIRLACYVYAILIGFLFCLVLDLAILK
jgi:hypothetical protein